MKTNPLIEPVFVAKTGLLVRAARLLGEHDIPSRHTSPKKNKGILRVARRDATAARSLLPQIDPDGIVSADEARHFFCPRCDAPLSQGVVRCQACDEFVGDPHAM